ncbi:MAG: hypothetical protein A2Z96_02080 [Spirochaetes bacterium GWB1_48_6]|nr:MAG: hypothetical protein A2Z96_02080 [Spirochaetes bacterium GWB1_48_6]
MADIKLINPVGPFFSTQRLWYVFSAGLLLPLSFGLFQAGISGLILALTVVFSSFGFGTLLSWTRKTTPLMDSGLLFQSLLLAAVLPSDLSPLMGMASGFLLLFLRQLLGKTPWLNPVLILWILVYLSWMPTVSTTVDGVSSSTPLSNVKNSFVLGDTKVSGPMEAAAISRTSFDQNTTDWLNNHVFGLFNVNLPGGYLDLVFGHHKGSLGEISGFFILLSSVFLLSFRLISWEIPLVYFLSHSVCIWIFGGLPLESGFFTGDILFYTISGSLILSLFFLATDFTTTPLTRKGKILYGLLAGLFVATLRLGSTLPEGTAVALLLMNFLVPLIERGLNKLKI